MIVIETANFSYKYSLKSWNGMILDFPGGPSIVTNSLKEGNYRVRVRERDTTIMFLCYSIYRILSGLTCTFSPHLCNFN